MQLLLWISGRNFDTVFNSQFPLWDFFECNNRNMQSFTEVLLSASQFPLWDFFECNQEVSGGLMYIPTEFSQFPLWDFFECNTALKTYIPAEIVKQLLSIPFVGFLRMQQRNDFRRVLREFAR